MGSLLMAPDFSLAPPSRADSSTDRLEGVGRVGTGG